MRLTLSTAAVLAILVVAAAPANAQTLSASVPAARATCAINGGSATAPPMPAGPGSGYWDLSGVATCAWGAQMFTAQVLVTDGFYSTLACGTGSGDGTLTLRYPAGSYPAKTFPIVVPIATTWVSLQQTVTGVNGTHAGSVGGTVNGEDTWIPTDGCAPAGAGHFAVAGTLVFTW